MDTNSTYVLTFHVNDYGSTDTELRLCTRQTNDILYPGNKQTAGNHSAAADSSPLARGDRGV